MTAHENYGGTSIEDDDDIVDDGFGNQWYRCGPDCDMQVVRPGRVQCSCP